METDPEVLITIKAKSNIISFEFPDCDEIDLPKNSLKEFCEYFRVLCENDIENQYITLNSYTNDQCRALRHFLICLCNGYNSIIHELPLEDSLKMLQFHPLFQFAPSIIQSLTTALAAFSYSSIIKSYPLYWNYKLISFEVMAKIALQENNLHAILDWLDEDSWVDKDIMLSEEFLKCRSLLEANPLLLAGTTKKLYGIISNYKRSYLIIDVKKILASIGPVEINYAKYG